MKKKKRFKFREYDDSLFFDYEDKYFLFRFSLSSEMGIYMNEMGTDWEKGNMSIRERNNVNRILLHSRPSSYLNRLNCLYKASQLIQSIDSFLWHVKNTEDKRYFKKLNYNEDYSDAYVFYLTDFKKNRSFFKYASCEMEYMFFIPLYSVDFGFFLDMRDTLFRGLTEMVDQFREHCKGTTTKMINSIVRKYPELHHLLVNQIAKK